MKNLLMTGLMALSGFTSFQTAEAQQVKNAGQVTIPSTNNSPNILPNVKLVIMTQENDTLIVMPDSQGQYRAMIGFRHLSDSSYQTDLYIDWEENRIFVNSPEDFSENAFSVTRFYVDLIPYNKKIHGPIKFRDKSRSP